MLSPVIVDALDFIRKRFWRKSYERFDKTGQRDKGGRRMGRRGNKSLPRGISANEGRMGSVGSVWERENEHGFPYPTTLQPMAPLDVQLTKGSYRRLQTLVDTGNNAALRLPHDMLDCVELHSKERLVEVEVANNQTDWRRMYKVRIRWMGEEKDVFAYFGGSIPAIGMEMFRGGRLIVDAHGGGGVFVKR